MDLELAVATDLPDSTTSTIHPVLKDRDPAVGPGGAARQIVGQGRAKNTLKERAERVDVDGVRAKVENLPNSE